MSSARVTSIDALRDFKAAIQRFIEEAAASVSEVDSESQRTTQWLRFDQTTYWQSQVRQRHELVEASKAELRRKQLTGMPDNPTAIDQRRAVDRARQREEAALEKIQRVRRWFPVMEREVTLYKGAVQPLLDALARDLPAAMLSLDRMIRTLEEYASISASQAGSGGFAAAPSTSADFSGFAALRRRTPRRTVRQALALTAPTTLPRPDEHLQGPPGGIFAHLTIVPAPPTPSDRVILEIGALDSGAFYLERLGEIEPGDSGWHAGSASPTPSAEAGFEATTIEHLLRCRPALAELLQLPPGHLAVVMGGGTSRPTTPMVSSAESLSTSTIEALLGPDDRQVYP